MDPFTLIVIAVVLIVASSTLIALTTKKTSTTNPDPSLLADFSLPQIAEGTSQAVVFGDVWLTDWQVLWYGNLSSEAIHPKSTSSKK